MDEPKLSNVGAVIVLRELQDWLYLCGMNGGTRLEREAIDIAIRALKSARTNVVYCNECIHYSKHKDDYMCGVNVLAYVRETDFCSRAERRTDG